MHNPTDEIVYLIYDYQEKGPENLFVSDNRSKIEVQVTEIYSKELEYIESNAAIWNAKTYAAKHLAYTEAKDNFWNLWYHRLLTPGTDVAILPGWGAPVLRVARCNRWSGPDHALDNVKPPKGNK